ncbi:unnamed protein product [Clonostachys rosea]|uniref:Uncharacterized protein n=1 Tax=Bionectria ochroleuca TaxID=29856 RepID=A0ABY6U7J5_BIOOC|nr:unnamed protein product [Clonostachys rosea]
MQAKEALAQSLSKMGRYAEALELRADIHEFREATLSAEHPETCLAAINLATSMQQIGSLARDSPWTEEITMIHYAESRLSDVLGKNHIVTLRAKSNIVRLYLARKDFPRALEKVLEVKGIMADRGVKLESKQTGDYDQDILDYERLYAELLLRRWSGEDQRNALSLWRRIVKRLVDQNAGTRQVSFAILRVARCYMKSNELDEAEAKVLEASRLQNDGFYDNTLDCKVLQAEILERRADICDSASNSGSEDDQGIRPKGVWVPEDRNRIFRHIWLCQNRSCAHLAGKPYVMDACYCRLSRRQAGRMCCCHRYMRFKSLESDSACSYEADSSSCSSEADDFEQAYLSLDEKFRCYNRQCRKPRHTCVHTKGSGLQDIMPSKIGCYCRPSVSMPNRMLCCHCHKPMTAISRERRWGWGVTGGKHDPGGWDSSSDIGTNCPSGSEDFRSVIDASDLSEANPNGADDSSDDGGGGGGDDCEHDDSTDDDDDDDDDDSDDDGNDADDDEGDDEVSYGLKHSP